MVMCLAQHSLSPYKSVEQPRSCAGLTENLEGFSSHAPLYSRSLCLPRVHELAQWLTCSAAPLYLRGNVLLIKAVRRLPFWLLHEFCMPGVGWGGRPLGRRFHSASHKRAQSSAFEARCAKWLDKQTTSTTWIWNKPKNSIQEFIKHTFEAE